jgi:hypothetical protein
VHEGIAESIENRTIEFDLSAVDRKFDPLAQLAGDFARHAR